MLTAISSKSSFPCARLLTRVRLMGTMNNARFSHRRLLCFAASAGLGNLSRSALLTSRSARCPLQVSRSPMVYHRRNMASMNISDEVSSRLKTAMKSKDAQTVKALRGIRASFITALKEKGEDSLGDPEAIKCLRKLEKMRKESIEMFQKGGRQDLVEEEQKDLAIIQEYLPQLAGEDQVRKWVQQAVDTTGASRMGDMGKVIGAVMKDHKAAVDGGVVRKIATEVLS
eukprot:Plantae.Rhodophyta-Hildenbrandia_rubra.ctg9951.p1 GENE.Plantae.Rhodophyta-Hildenbrandia_rubra.ctg9951~~Plantae.Rhodophyta-Hildenbrandia_rubra.ctg9951.p1  ORF type:complete len:228 (+),score=44.42 Plantae.Rhodophyta-Hildenbrandia_rubra.ctg9951:261-944(+)